MQGRDDAEQTLCAVEEEMKGFTGSDSRENRSDFRDMDHST